MNTKQALRALSKGDKKSEGIQEPRLAERAQDYLAQFDARQAGIIAKKNRDTVNVPALEVLRRKVAEMAGQTERTTPVAMRFHVYTAMKSAAEANTRDRGLQQAVRHLEHLWRQEPMGSLTLGQTMDLRAHVHDTFPKSKVAKTLDAVISRVGYSTLPVAKLARIAQQIETQADFDSMIKSAGLDGNRPDQIKGRTLIRELVTMKGAKVASEATADERSNMERVTDRVAKEAQMHQHVCPHCGGKDLVVTSENDLPSDPPNDVDDVNNVAPVTVITCQDCGTENEVPVGSVPELPRAKHQFNFDPNKQAQMLPPPELEPAVEPGLPGEELVPEDTIPGDDLTPDGIPAPEMSESSEESVDSVVPMIEEVDQIVQDTMPPAAEPYVEKELDEDGALPGTAEWGFMEAEEGHSAPPPSPEWQAEELAEHGVGPDVGNNMMGKPPMSEPAIEEVVMDEVMPTGPAGKLARKRIEIQAAMGTRAQHEPSLMALPKPNFQHDVERQQTVQQLDSDYKAGRLPTAEYLRQKRFLEERARVRTHVPGAAPLDPDSFEQKVAEGLDAPKPPADGQYGGKRNNDAPDRSKDGGKELTKDETKKAFILTATEIEAALIDRGEEVRYGSACLRINESDEVEFWHRGAGKACGLSDLDTAITDFISATASEHKSTQPKGSYYVATLVPVPCARCAKVDTFEFTADATDVYACGECDHRTKAASIAALVKHGQLSRSYNVAVCVPGYTTASSKAKKAFVSNLGRMVKTVRGSLSQGGANGWNIVVPNTDGVIKLTKVLTQLGITQRTAQFDAGSVSAPGSADQALPMEMAPAGGGAPTPAPQQGQQDTQAPGAAAPGTITGEDIAAAFRHYKAMELPFPEAMAQFAKDYKEKIEAGWQSPQMDAELIDIARQLYTSSGTSPSTAQVMQARVAWNLAKNAFNAPKVNRQQPDAVKVEKFPGSKNTDEKPMDCMVPEKPKASGKQPGAGKQPGTKAPPTDMGETGEDKHPSGLDAPKPPSDGHVDGAAGDQPGTAPAGSKELGKDSDHNGKDIPLPGKFGPRPKTGTKAKKLPKSPTSK